MKAAYYKSFLLKTILGCLAAFGWMPVFSQGRVLINEYLPWPNNACGTTAEFIELLNFGPGPVDISCYVITDGDFSITIPPNTMLAPGSFYLLAGQNTIYQSCGNDTRNATVNLNWNTCGCTSGPIPTTGDGLMTDGGTANEQVVLLNASGKVVDAIARSLPVEPSAGITIVSAGGCSPFSFDLDTMAISYEIVGESTGRGNSISRRTDGACFWMKETQESAGDPNDVSGDTELDASLTITNGLTCTNTGSVVASILSGDMSQIFPVSFVLAKDTDSNLAFTAADSYLYGMDSTASTVPVSGLTPGRYKLHLGPATGCDEAMFDFTILQCNEGLLTVAGQQNPGAATGQQHLRAYPNPFTDHVTLSFNATRAGSDQLLLTDVTGRVGQSVPIQYSKGVNKLLLSLPNLLPGTWYLRFPSVQSQPISLIKVKK
jgi:hypothetical protein